MAKHFDSIDLVTRLLLAKRIETNFIGSEIRDGFQARLLNYIDFENNIFFVDKCAFSFIIVCNGQSIMSFYYSYDFMTFNVNSSFRQSKIKQDQMDKIQFIFDELDLDWVVKYV